MYCKLTFLHSLLIVERVPSPLTYSTAYELIRCILTQCIVTRVKPVYEEGYLLPTIARK